MQDEPAASAPDEMDIFLKHELLDRLHSIVFLFDELVRDHPAAELLRKETDEVSRHLGQLYQRAGTIRFDVPDDRPKVAAPAMAEPSDGAIYEAVSERAATPEMKAALAAEMTALAAAMAAQPDPYRRLTEFKTDDIVKRGYQKVGYVLENAAGDYCISAQSAVRWLPHRHYWRLMHEQDGSLFSDKP